MNDLWAGILGALGLLAGIALYVNTFLALKVRRAMADTPTSKVRSAAMGQVEFKGIARQWEHALRGPFSDSDCVWFKWLVEEEKTVYTRKGRRRRWVVVASGQSDRPFYLEDVTGSVKVNPAGAEITASRLLNYCSGGMFQSRRAPATSAARTYLSSPSRVRLQEWRIDLGRPIYVLGVLRNVRLDSGDKEDLVGKGKQGEPFLLSTSTEEALRKSSFWEAWGSLLGGTVLTMGCLGWLLARFVAPRVDFDFSKEVGAVFGNKLELAEPQAEKDTLGDMLKELEEKNKSKQDSFDRMNAEDFY